MIPDGTPHAAWPSGTMNTEVILYNAARGRIVIIRGYYCRDGDTNHCDDNWEFDMHVN